MEYLTERYIGEPDPEWGMVSTSPMSAGFFSWTKDYTQPALFCSSAVQSCMTEPVHPAYVSNPFPTCKYRALYPGIEETHFNGDPAKFAEMVYKLSRLDDPPVRLPLHRVALEAARKKGVSFLRAAESWASWSDDVYERRSASPGQLLRTTNYFGTLHLESFVLTD